MLAKLAAPPKPAETLAGLVRAAVRLEMVVVGEVLVLLVLTR